MNVYATNQPAEGYEFQGSFASLDEAQAWALARGDEYSYWWADEGDEEQQPKWAKEALVA